MSGAAGSLPRLDAQAVARRWSVNETFLPLTDVIEPLANGKVEYPPAFCEGALEGLLLDHDGRIRIRRSADIQLAVEVGQRSLDIAGRIPSMAWQNALKTRGRRTSSKARFRTRLPRSGVASRPSRRIRLSRRPLIASLRDLRHSAASLKPLPGPTFDPSQT